MLIYLQVRITWNYCLLQAQLFSHWSRPQQLQHLSEHRMYHLQVPHFSAQFPVVWLSLTNLQYCVLFTDIKGLLLLIEFLTKDQGEYVKGCCFNHFFPLKYRIIRIGVIWSTIHLRPQIGISTKVSQCYYYHHALKTFEAAPDDEMPCITFFKLRFL